MKDPDPKDLLTGRELKIAAERGLRVKYRRYGYDPQTPDMRWTGKMEKAKYGYYIADSDIDPDMFEDDEKVRYDDVDSYIGVYKVKGVNYEL